MTCSKQGAACEASHIGEWQRVGLSAGEWAGGQWVDVEREWVIEWQRVGLSAGEWAVDSE